MFSLTSSPSPSFYDFSHVSPFSDQHNQWNSQHTRHPDASVVPPNPDPNARYTYDSDYFSSPGDGRDDDANAAQSHNNRNRWNTPMTPFAQDDLVFPPPLHGNGPAPVPIGVFMPPVTYQYPASAYSAQTAVQPGSTAPGFIPLRSPARMNMDDYPEQMQRPNLDVHGSTDGRQRYPASPYPYDRRAFSNNAINERQDGGEWDPLPSVPFGTPGNAYNVGGFGMDLPSPTLVRSASAMGSVFGYGFDNGVRTGPRPRHRRPEQWREDYRPPRNGWAKLFGTIGRRRGESGSFSRNCKSPESPSYPAYCLSRFASKDLIYLWVI